MTELSKEILERWQVRKTKKQKTDFIAFLQEKLPGIQIEEGGTPKSRNLVLGDLDSAQVVFSAHYDTAAVTPFPNFLTPKNIPLYILFNLLIVVVVFFLVFLVSRLTAALFHSFWVSYFSGIGVCFLCLFLMMGGKANKHTANDNTSGVISLCEIYSALSPEQRAKTAFVFFDNEELGLFGSRYFLKLHKEAMKEKLLINLDCVSDGDHILLIQNKAAKARWGAALEAAFAGENCPAGMTVRMEKSSTTLYPSDQMGFPCYMAVAAFHRKRGIGLCMTRIHTSRDTVFQEENVAHIRDSAVRLVEGLSLPVKKAVSRAKN